MILQCNVYAECLHNTSRDSRMEGGTRDLVIIIREVIVIASYRIHRRGEGEGDPVFVLRSLPLDNGDPGRNVCGTRGRAGRIPQSIGAASPHLICVLSPQSSHSRTGFHPSLFAHISHFAAIALEKKNPNGVHGWLGSAPTVMPIGLAALAPLAWDEVPAPR